jgi:hypothetical protein
MVAKQCEDAGSESCSYGTDVGPRSDAYLKYKLQAELIAKDTLYNNVASLETIQGLSMVKVCQANASPHGVLGRHGMARRQ